MSTMATSSKSALPILGTWKLLKTETSHPDVPHPVTGITNFKQEQDGIHYTNEGTYSDGRSATVSCVFQIDGNWYPLSGSLLADSLSCRELEDGSLEVKMRNGGAESGRNLTTVSADGRTLTGDWQLNRPGAPAVRWKTTAERQ